MVLDDSTMIAIGAEPIRLLNDEEVIGWVTSGGYGYSVEKSIAYGYLPLPSTKPGTQVDIEFFGERIPSVVSSEPLWDPGNYRIRS
jgi:4-methylaminobutanoate oxidase (formaldehyde-forming)